MPKRTFFNLPSEKRTTLLGAARSEFARAPFGDASINRIVHAAGISRGSFYMYFSDKEDLFLYLISLYGQQIRDLICTLLGETQGDPFAALIRLFDLAVSRAGLPEYQDLLSILRLNQHLQLDLFLREKPSGCHAGRLYAMVDPELLDLREEGDLEASIQLLLSTAGPILVRALLSQSAEPFRTTLKRRLALLQRGISAKTVLRAAAAHT